MRRPGTSYSGPYRARGTEVDEAILDFVMHIRGGFLTVPLDVTIRCPHADRYLQSDTTPGIASQDAELEKIERYGSTVSPIALESYGRMGIASQQALKDFS